MRKIISLVLLTVLIVGMVPAADAAAVTGCTRETFLKMVLTACNVAYTDSDYLEKAADYGLIRESTFSNYTWRTTKTDAAIILVRADYYLNGNKVSAAKAEAIMKGITDISLVSHARGVYLAKAVHLGFIAGSKDPTEEYPNAIKAGALSYISLGTAKRLVAMLKGDTARNDIADPGLSTVTVTVTPTPAPTVPAVSEYTFNHEYEDAVFELINKERTVAGASKLAFNETLRSAAESRAVEISEYFSHTRPNGQSCFTIIDEYNITNYSSLAENIAYGQRTPQLVMTAWMNSEGHRENLLNTKYTQVGVGCYEANGTIYWVQIFMDLFD